MQEKKKQYILDDLLRIILAMFVLTVLFAFSCLLLSHGAHGIWLAVLALFVLLGVLGGVFLRRCLRIIQKNEQVMQLYAAGYTIADICHLKCYFSRGTEMALKKAVALLDTGKLLSVSRRSILLCRTRSIRISSIIRWRESAARRLRVDSMSWRI